MTARPENVAELRRQVDNLTEFRPRPRPHFPPEEPNRDRALAEQRRCITTFITDQIEISRTRRAVKEARESAHEAEGLTGPAPDNETRARKAKLSRDARQAVMAERGMDRRLPDVGDALLITGGQGTGKSATTARTLADTELARHGDVAWFMVPTIARAEEQATEYRTLTSSPVTVVRGRSAPDPKRSGQPMCPRHAVVDRAARVGVNVEEQICRTCPLRKECGTQRQKRTMPAAGLFVGANAYLFLPGPMPAADLVVSDETALPQAAGAARMTPATVLSDDIWSGDNISRALERRRIAGLVREALVDHRDHALEHIREHVTLAEIQAGVAHLKNKIQATPEITGSMSDAEIVRQLEALQATEAAKVRRLFLQIEREWHADRPGLNSVTATGDDDGQVLAVHFLKKPRIDKTTPLLLLDGTGSLELNRRAFRRPEMAERRFAVPRDAEVIQLTGKTFSRQSLTGLDRNDQPITRTSLADAERLRGHVANVLRLAGTSPVFLASNMPVVEALEGSLPTNVEAAHFGSIRGLNRFEGCEVAVIVGREQPGPSTVESATRAFIAEDDDPLVAADAYQLEARGRRMRDGSVTFAEVHVHPDPRCQAMLEQAREAEIVQAVDRVRPVFNRRRIIVLSDGVYDLTLDRALPWADAKPSKFDIVFARHGVLPLAQADLHRMFPDLWTTPKAAEHELRRRGMKGPQNPNRNLSIWERGTLRLVAYRRAGRGQNQPREAFAYVSSRHDEPRQALEQLVGPLQTFRLCPSGEVPANERRGGLSLSHGIFCQRSLGVDGDLRAMCVHVVGTSHCQACSAVPGRSDTRARSGWGVGMVRARSEQGGQKSA